MTDTPYTVYQLSTKPPTYPGGKDVTTDELKTNVVKFIHAYRESKKTGKPLYVRFFNNVLNYANNIVKVIQVDDQNFEKNMDYWEKMAQMNGHSYWAHYAYSMNVTLGWDTRQKKVYTNLSHGCLEWLEGYEGPTTITSMRAPKKPTELLSTHDRLGREVRVQDFVVFGYGECNLEFGSITKIKNVTLKKRDRLTGNVDFQHTTEITIKPVEINGLKRAYSEIVTTDHNQFMMLDSEISKQLIMKRLQSQG